MTKTTPNITVINGSGARGAITTSGEGTENRISVARRDYIEALHEDVWIRKHIRSRLSRAGISSIDIERKGDQIWVYIRTARPGIVIGRKGAEVDRLRKDVERNTKKRVDVKVEDMNQAASESRPETDATLLAQGVAEQLAGRVAFRRAMRRAVQTLAPAFNSDRMVQDYTRKIYIGGE